MPKLGHGTCMFGLIYAPPSIHVDFNFLWYFDTHAMKFLIADVCNAIWYHSCGPENWRACRQVSFTTVSIILLWSQEFMLGHSEVYLS